MTKTTHHFGSSGAVYSFGNRGNFDMIDNSSLTTCTTRHFKNEERDSHVEIDADKMDQLCANEVAHTVASISKLVPNIKKLLSPIVNTVQKK